MKTEKIKYICIVIHNQTRSLYGRRKDIKIFVAIKIAFSLRRKHYCNEFIFNDDDDENGLFKCVCAFISRNNNSSEKKNIIQNRRWFVL